VDGVDVNHDCLADFAADVAAAMQFTLELPANGSASIDLQYVLGSYDNANPAVMVDSISCDARDTETVLDRLQNAIRLSESNTEFDFTADGKVDLDDLREYVTSPDHLHTYFGDANLDGEFNSNDFVMVFGDFEYEDTIEDNSTWSEGDWNADGDFDSADFIVAFSGGGYEQGPRSAALTQAVPEPNSSAILMGVFVCLYAVVRRGQVCA
ncbi:MAG: hypothetical protein R3C28_26615, partial [Pirellulaceae bacterium]